MTEKTALAMQLWSRRKMLEEEELFLQRLRVAQDIRMMKPRMTSVERLHNERERNFSLRTGPAALETRNGFDQALRTCSRG
eukprot:357554-Chlamydomonas_euryale.AAC.4